MAGVKARIALKSLETLTYSCTDAEMLLEVEERLQSLLQDLKAQLPQEEGLVSNSVKSHKTKRKYAHITESDSNQGTAVLLQKEKSVGEKEPIQSSGTE